MSTIKDVAKASGVSTATVSYVLNNRSVRPGTKQRVLRAMHELDYHPNAIARGLSRKCMNTLGLIMLHSGKALLTDPYYSLVLDGIFDVSLNRNQNIMIFNGHSWNDAERSIATFADGRCDGFLIILPPVETPLIPALQKRGLPFVVVSERGGDPSVSSIDIDNRDTARRATEYLLELGHRRITHLAGEPHLESAHERSQGFLDALRAARIPDAETWVLPGQYGEPSGYERTREIVLTMTPRPTAVFGGDDLAALGALRAAREAGLSVPQELSILGINGNTQGETSDPPLTTFSQSLHRLGERATEMLITLIESPAPTVVKTIQPTEIIIRATTAPLTTEHQHRRGGIIS